jgi:UDP-glucose 4-epimerase
VFVRLVNESILIIGGTGSLGRALIRRLKADNSLSIFSRDEAKHWTIKNQLSPSDDVSFHIGDVRDFTRVREVLERTNPTIVIIASALKQVDTCEISPFESIQTNTLGVSTDKACAPTNVYGMSKALAERLVTSYYTWETGVKFVAVRYGNVLESRGSIIPLFKHQIETDKALTVTDKRMTRFIMTLNQSIDLIEDAISESKSGEIWIPKIPAMQINDLAEIFASKFRQKIEITGMRPGEKLHEDLVSESESIRTKELGNHFVIENSTKPIKETIKSKLFCYSSNRDLLTKQQLESRLDELGIFEIEVKDFLGREIEEIRGRL